MFPLQKLTKLFQIFALLVFLSTMSPFSTQAEDTCTIEGVSDCMYEVTKDVGAELNLTCKCSAGIPLWEVKVYNICDKYLVSIYGNYGPPGTKFVDGMETINGTNYSLATIIMTITDSTVLQCKSTSGPMQAVTKPFVVVVNTEPECPSPTPCQLTTIITVNSTMGMIPTPAPSCICSSLSAVVCGNLQLSGEINSAGTYFTANDTLVPTPSMSMTKVSKGCSNVATTLHFTTTRVTTTTITTATVTTTPITTATITTTTITTLCTSPNDIVYSSPSVVGSNLLSSEEISLVTTPNTVSADPCLLTNEETVGLSSSIAITVVIQSFVIVALLIIICTKVNCCQKNDKLHLKKIEATNGLVIEMNEEAIGQESVQSVLENGKM